MSRKNWTAEKLFKRLLTNKTRKTYWDNKLELRRRTPELVHTRAIQLCKSESEKEKEIGIDLLAQSGLNTSYCFLFQKLIHFFSNNISLQKVVFSVTQKTYNKISH